MSAEILPLRPTESIEALWDAYHALAQATLERPALAADRAHIEKLVRAHKRFADALNRRDGSAACR